MLELLPYANLPGYLVDGQNDEEGSCLVFRPDGALAAGRLRHSASGSITYGYRQQMQRVPSVRSVQPSVLSGFLRAFSGSGREAGGGASMLRMMHLRSGDTVPCEVLRIDDEGVHFQSDVTQSTVVPHEEIKAIVLANTAAESAVTDEKWRRLLTVPRMQKGNEPTHLICAKSGDFLRGRLVGMDDETLQLETRLETIAIPRFRVAQIIWLHMDELESGTLEKDPPSPDTVGANQKMRIQAVRADSNRLTFYPERVRDSLIDGHSPVLGACRVSVVEAETILLGSAIRAAAADLRFSQFVLRPATDPRFVTAEGQSSAESGEPGMQSPLVGTPAPEFRLDLLDGTSFQLSEHRGRVIVLDFWASWCGPCIQAMPEVDSIAGSFEDQGVRLVAVNLQETPDRINAALERLQLDTTVALDRDGAIAARYRATAIPQTVIIDRQGNIARLFVGGGREFPELFRAALETVVAQP
jgi:thiol-disulfide isomerase/thioredoxin